MHPSFIFLQVSSVNIDSHLFFSHFIRSFELYLALLYYRYSYYFDSFTINFVEFHNTTLLLSIKTWTGTLSLHFLNCLWLIKWLNDISITSRLSYKRFAWILTSELTIVMYTRTNIPIQIEGFRNLLTICHSLLFLTCKCNHSFSKSDFTFFVWFRA